MRVDDIIAQALHGLNVPYYFGMPEFSEDAVPGRLITYTYYARPQLYGDGSEQLTRYYVTVSYFARTKNEADGLAAEGNICLLRAGFGRLNVSYTMDNDFPGFYRNIFEYVIDLDE